MAYTPGDMLVRAVMTASTGLPEDQVINDFVFQAAGAPTSTDWTNAFAAVDGFYRTTTASTFAVGQFISNFVNRSATHELQGWVIHAGPLGSPAATESWLGPVASNSPTGLPAEVAGVLSYHADLTGVLEESGSTRPKARRRGRIYVGPLNANVLIGGTPPYYLNVDFPYTLRAAATDMADAAAADGLTWSVWSRADATLRPVVGGWTDNAPDTMRRRGPAASTRVTFSV